MAETPGEEETMVARSDRAAAKLVIERLQRDKNAEVTDTEIETVIGAGVEDLHNAVLPMTIVSLLYGITVLVQIVALPLVPILAADWYLTFPSYRIFLPPAMGLFLFGYIIYAYLHLLKSWAYTVHKVLVGVWSVAMTVLWVWLWLEMFWYCPTYTPTYCTNGITSTLDGGYLIYAIATLIQAPVLWIELVIYGRALYYWRVLYRATGLTGTNLASLIYGNPRWSDRYAVTIGKQKRF